MTSPKASGASASPALRLVAVDKRFGALHAVWNAELTVQPGALHAVVGENGAGKSTLLKIAAGVLSPDAGEVWIAGERQPRYDARRARDLGIAMVQQHFALFEDLTALENMILGCEPVGKWWTLRRLDIPEARVAANAVLGELGVTLDLDARVATLGVGDRQRLEIARALYRDARVLILDEPTAVLTPQEADALYATLRRLAAEGRAVVVVTHKLDEVETHADVVTVMRRGETLSTRAVRRDGEAGRLAGELVGGEPLPDRHPPLSERDARDGTVNLRVRSLTCGRALRGVSFEVRRGEIVGIAGVLGNGQSELLLVLGGLLDADGGDVTAGTLEVVHEDRQGSGLVLDASVEENLVLGQLSRFTRLGIVDDAQLRAAATERIERFDVRPPDPRVPARALSGGNQQKVVLARALAVSPSVLVVAHPTRGVDLHAARAIHDRILAAAAGGAAVLLIGADLGELRLLCRRVLVILRGRIVAEFLPTASDAEIGAAMLGSAPGPAS